LEFNTIYTAVPVPDPLPPYNPDCSDGLHFVSVGRIHWTKAFHDLLLALKNLFKHGISARLTIIGNGPDEARLRFWIEKFGLQNHAYLPEKLDTDQIREIMGRAHAYVQTSLAEGFSNTVAEAMAWGCPVFATDVGGTAELIRDGGNGFLLQPLQPGSWFKRLELAKDRSLMKRIREAGYETARQQFIAFYQGVLEGKRQVMTSLQQEVSPLKSTVQSSPIKTNASTVLVIGRWEWRTGADQVIRAVAKAAEGQRLPRVIVVGHGSQEDELRYLAHFLGFSQPRFIQQDYDVNALAGQRVDVLIRLPEKESGPWRIAPRVGQDVEVPFGDCLALVKVLTPLIAGESETSHSS
jgi:glycosyltransferase involved in cell wall biosynthesis